MWKTNSSKIIFQNKWIKLYTDQIEFDDGKPGEYTYLSRHDGAHVVVINPNNELLLLKQYRYPTRAYEWSIPGGKIDSGESPEVSAKREASEELGVQIGKIIPLGIWIAQSTLNTEKLHMFVGWTSDSPKIGGLDNESVSAVQSFSADEILQMIDSGQIPDPSISSALQIVIRKYVSPGASAK